MAIADEKDRIVAIVYKETKNKLKLLAKTHNRSLSNYVADILEKHVKEENNHHLK